MLFIPFVDVVNVDSPDLMIESMQSVEKNEIACVNWPDLYPSDPKVSFKIAHNGTHLFIHYFVEEGEILAKTAEDNGPVWTDSCVEFFIAFNESTYYNAEFSCIGKALLAHRIDKSNGKAADSSIMNQIKRYPSLGTQPFDKRKGDFKWNLLIAIPILAYSDSGLDSFSGIKAKANFYKCGDNLTIPHYLSWNPIHTEKPNFHQPQFFGDVYFGKQGEKYEK